MPPHDATIRLPAFEGPLDLLLQLIVRAELDVTEIALAEVADQYLERVRGLRTVDVEQAAEFLVLAATLVEIKSRRLAPAEDAPAQEQDQQDPAAPGDPAGELISQLLAYRAYRDAGEALDALQRSWASRYAGVGAVPAQSADRGGEGDEPGADLDDIELYDLVCAFRAIAATVQFDRLGDHQVGTDDTPIELHAADITDRLDRTAADGTLTLWSLFEGRPRAEIIGLFLALLELVRQRRVRVRARPAGDAENTAKPGAGIVLEKAEHTWDDDHIFGGDDEDEPGDDDGEDREA